MKFFKAHAIGNDFILIKTSQSVDAIQKNFILTINNRFTGIGADQVLALDDNNNVKIWTEDGSEIMLCGNGLRCLGKLLDKSSITVNTASGPVILKNLEDGNVLMRVQKNPIIEKFDDYYTVNVGNLHKVYFVPDNSIVDIVPYVNDDYIVSFLSNKDDKWLIRTMETHTTKETLACGSASLASAYVLNYLGHKDLTVHFKYGSIAHKLDDNRIIQIGPATIVAELNFLMPLDLSN